MLLHGVSEQLKGFVTYSKAFKSYYQGYKAFFDKAEWRAKEIYDLNAIGIKPWDWDYENYSGKNKFMIGYFYTMDIENIKQIHYYETHTKK